VLKRGGLSSAGDVLKIWQRRQKMDVDRMVILHQVWEREAGGLAGHWTLRGVKGGILYVKTRSSAAAQELQLRGPSLVRGINKYFRRPWIKSIRAAKD
jgi:hypothetical protein